MIAHKTLAAITACAVISLAADTAPKIDKQTFRVSLSNGLGTATSKTNDQITGTVLEPAEYVGWEMSGHIGKLTPAKRGSSKPAELEFQLETLAKEGVSPVPVSADVISVANSKGAPDVDEEGHVIGHTSNGNKVKGGIVGGLAGAGIGWATGGAKGAAIGAASGAVAGVLLVKFATKGGEDIRFEKGATLTLQVSSRGKK